MSKMSLSSFNNSELHLPRRKTCHERGTAPPPPNTPQEVCLSVPTCLCTCAFLCVCVCVRTIKPNSGVLKSSPAQRASFISSRTLQVCESPPPPLLLPPLTHPTPSSGGLSLHQQGLYCGEGKTIALGDGFSYAVTPTTLSLLPHATIPPQHGSLHLGEAACTHPFISFSGRGGGGVEG